MASEKQTKMNQRERCSPIANDRKECALREDTGEVVPRSQTARTRTAHSWGEAAVAPEHLASLRRLRRTVSWQQRADEILGGS
eukprot:6526088-Prymnesium_polylepis.1